MSTASPTLFACGLCGHSFTHGDRACASCSLVAGCELVKCPRCGYQFPRESQLVGWFACLARRLGVGA